jgi:hypothetical protein
MKNGEKIMYCPDKWVMVKVTRNVLGDKTLYKIFGSWYDINMRWRLNSGVTKITEDPRSYYFEGYSGSVYMCNKLAYGTTEYGENILKDIIVSALEVHDCVVEILPEETNFMELVYE